MTQLKHDVTRKGSTESRREIENDEEGVLHRLTSLLLKEQAMLPNGGRFQKKMKKQILHVNAVRFRSYVSLSRQKPRTIQIIKYSSVH